jgi:hypothetical protein
MPLLCQLYALALILGRPGRELALSHHISLPLGLCTLCGKWQCHYVGNSLEERLESSTPGCGQQLQVGSGSAFLVAAAVLLAVELVLVCWLHLGLSAFLA